MKINIVKIDKNIDYIDKKDYMLKLVDNEGVEYETENIGIHCERLWETVY